MSFNKLRLAGEVSHFMQELSIKYTERWNKVRPECIPFGDLSYAEALADWYIKGRQKNAWFSYANGEVACPYLMEFRKEITEEFGLKILTKEESMIEDKKHQKVMLTKVFDWGPN